MALWNETSDIPKCSGCGSNIYFDTNFQKLSCKSCGSFFDPATLEFAYQIEVPDKAKKIKREMDM